MNAIDIVFLILLLWAAWKGFKRGLVIELASLAALVLGIYAALNFSAYASRLLSGYVDLDPYWLNILSFALTFLGVMLAVILLGKILEKMVNLVMLGLLNKILGLVFSVLKTAVVLSVLIFLFNLIDHNQRILTPEKRQDSRLFGIVEALVPELLERMDLPEGPFSPPAAEEEKETIACARIAR